MIHLYSHISHKSSKLITKKYSTSFTLGIKLLAPSIQSKIYSIYGFVRVADEIVDTFDGYPQRTLLDEFKRDTYLAIERKVSTNPVLHAFQEIVNEYQIDHQLIEQFFKSMYMDLEDQDYNRDLYDQYIVGSAEVIGLMCLKIFVNKDEQKYKELEDSARRLGAVFQKVNFLRDAHFDYGTLNRIYFPNLDFDNITEDSLEEIFSEIEEDFDAALKGIVQLSPKSRFGVYLAYRYYRKLFRKIRYQSRDKFLKERIRIPNMGKYFILLKTYVRYQLNMLS